MSFGQLIWSKGPDLLLTRHAHRSIAIQNEIYHVGGEYRNIKTEKWTIKEDEIKQEILDLELNYYYLYPELFAVADNYCK